MCDAHKKTALQRADCSDQRIQACTLIHAYTHKYTHTQIHTYVHKYIHTFIHTDIHTYIHEFIHRQWMNGNKIAVGKIQ